MPKSMTKRYLATFATLAVTGCAANPEDIKPSYVSPLTFRDRSCEQLAQELARIRPSLSEAEEAQRKTRSNDIAGVIFLGLPVGSMSGGGQESYIGRLKGEMETIRKVAIEKNCSIAAPQSIPEVRTEESSKPGEPKAATSDRNDSRLTALDGSWMVKVDCGTRGFALRDGKVEFASGEVTGELDGDPAEFSFTATVSADGVVDGSAYNGDNLIIFKGSVTDWENGYASGHASSSGRGHGCSAPWEARRAG